MADNVARPGAEGANTTQEIERLRALVAEQRTQLEAMDAQLEAKVEAKVTAIRYDVLLKERASLQRCRKPCRSTEFQFLLPPHTR